MKQREVTRSPSQSASERRVLPERPSSHEQRADAAVEAAADVVAKYLKAGAIGQCVLFVTFDVKDETSLSKIVSETDDSLRWCGDRS